MKSAPSWIEENNLGDPQKLEPAAAPPGHDRIALAVNSVSELPVDMEVATPDSERGPWSVSAKIDPADRHIQAIVVYGAGSAQGIRAFACGPARRIVPSRLTN